MKKYMTREEVALYYRVSTQTIWRWVREGRLASIKIGGRVLFDIDIIQSTKVHQESPTSRK